MKGRVVWLLFLVPAVAGMTLEDMGPDRILFETKLGPVAFAHSGHAQLLNQGCTGCHHQEKKGDRQPCRRCHKKKAETAEGDPPSFYQVKMDFCRGCHLERREGGSSAKAPIHCERCHDIRKMAN